MSFLSLTSLRVFCRYEPIFKAITLDGREVWRRRVYRVRRAKVRMPPADSGVSLHHITCCMHLPADSGVKTRDITLHLLHAIGIWQEALTLDCTRSRSALNATPLLTCWAAGSGHLLLVGIGQRRHLQ